MSTTSLRPSPRFVISAIVLLSALVLVPVAAAASGETVSPDWDSSSCPPITVTRVSAVEPSAHVLATT